MPGTSQRWLHMSDIRHSPDAGRTGSCTSAQTDSWKSRRHLLHQNDAGRRNMYRSVCQKIDYLLLDIQDNYDII